MNFGFVYRTSTGFSMCFFLFSVENRTARWKSSCNIISMRSMFLPKFASRWNQETHRFASPFDESLLLLFVLRFEQSVATFNNATRRFVSPKRKLFKNNDRRSSKKISCRTKIFFRKRKSFFPAVKRRRFFYSPNRSSAIISRTAFQWEKFGRRSSFPMRKLSSNLHVDLWISASSFLSSNGENEKNIFARTRTFLLFFFRIQIFAAINVRFRRIQFFT